MRYFTILVSIIIFLGQPSLSVARPCPDGTTTYKIDIPVGGGFLTVDCRNEENDKLKVAIKECILLNFPYYQFESSRTEIWENDMLSKYEAKSAEECKIIRSLKWLLLDEEDCKFQEIFKYPMPMTVKAEKINNKWDISMSTAREGGNMPVPDPTGTLLFSNLWNIDMFKSETKLRDAITGKPINDPSEECENEPCYVFDYKFQDDDGVKEVQKIKVVYDEDGNWQRSKVLGEPATYERWNKPGKNLTDKFECDLLEKLKKNSSSK